MSAVPIIDEAAELEQRLSPECECGQPKSVGALRCYTCAAKHRPPPEARPPKPRLELVDGIVHEDAPVDLHRCPNNRAHRIVDRVRGPWCPSCQGFVYLRQTLDGDHVVAIWRNKP